MTVEVELINHHGDWLIMTEDGDICADFGNGWSRLEAENLFDSWLMDKRDRFKGGEGDG